MCYALSFLFIFSIGGLTGLFLGALGTNVPLHDTYFIVAHFHYVMMGSALIAFIGGLHYWWPKMTGKMYSEFFGRLACAFIFIGFNLTFFTQFLLGTKGMPRRYWDYKPQFTSYHQISTIGAFTMAIGFFIVAGTLIYSLWKGRRAPANPWGASTLEWRCPSPPPTENFLAAPTVGDVYVYDDMRYDPETRGYYFPDTPADANVVPHHIGPVVDGSDNGHNGA
jgi:cytochrome c oxidase subunit 1